MTRRDLRNRAPRFHCAPLAPAPQRRSAWPGIIRAAFLITIATAAALAVAHHFGA